MRAKLIASFAVLCLSLTGCAASGGSGPGAEALLPPQVAALSTYAAATGTLVEVYGTDFPDRRLGRTMLVFQGTFDADAGGSHPVDLELDATRLDPGTLRWDSFGPYRQPFSPTGNETGIFHGTVAARVLMDSGEVVEGGDPLAIDFRVEPSILVHELQPTTGSCGAPVQRALGGAPYRIRVEAVGFTPATFTYTIATPALEGVEPVSIRHVATGPFDSVGEHGDFVMPEVPDDVLTYGAVLTIQAVDTTGRVRQSVFAIGVHRPLEFFYNGNVAVAEVMAPVPVSACIPGGEAGRDASYNESTSETRSRSYSLNWNETWLSSHTVSASSSSTVGLSETNGVGFATTDGQEFRWDMGGELGGSIGVDKLAALSAKATWGVGGTTSRTAQESANRSQGLNSSETTTDAESASEAAGGSSGGEFSWEVSSTESVARGFGGVVIARTYGVFYRQALRLMRRGVLVTYNQCGAADVVAEVDFTDWTWSPDLALGDSCPPLPQSNLPAAECLISPCLGE